MEVHQDGAAVSKDTKLHVFHVCTCGNQLLPEPQGELAGLNPGSRYTRLTQNETACIKMLFNHLNVNSKMNIRPRIFRILQTLDGVLITRLKISCESVRELFPCPFSFLSLLQDCLKMTSLFWVSCLKC